MEIIVSKPDILHGGHGFVNPLGHEIHITRFILFDMLNKGVISNNVKIITLTEDRFFLYNKQFKNVHRFENYNFGNQVLDLTFYSTIGTQNIQIPEFKTLCYNLNKFEKSFKFIDYINDMDFCEINIEKFILIHIRVVKSQPKQHQLLKIIDKIKNGLPIVVFCSIDLNLKLNGVLFINNLQLYASYLNNKNCELFISEWSGGGQLAQYCCNCNIFYYFDNYESHDYEINYQEYQEYANNKLNIFNCWDFKTTTNCNYKFFKTLNIMLNYVYFC
jgi:hypothetical protein